MSEVASAFVSLIPSAKGFANGISKEIGGDLDKAGQDGGRKLGGGVKTGFSKVSGGVKALIGGAIGGFVAVGVAKLTGFARGAVDAFAAVEDATGAARVQFGKALPQVTAFADKAFESFGLSKRAALDAQNTFGTLGKSAGLQGKPLADFAGKFAGLAGDLASFKGTSSEQAIAAVGAALRGESEPIRAYGVLLDDASLRQEALAQGLIKTTKQALTPQQKVLATQALLLKQTADAEDDFSRTSDSTANTQKRLQAATENAQAALGEKLAPAVTAVRTGFLGLLQGASRFIDFIGPGMAVVQDVARTLIDVLFKGDFTGGPFAEDSTFIAVLFRIRDGFLSLGTFITTTVIPAFASLAGFVSRNTDFFIPFAGAVVAIVAAMKVWAAVQAALNIVLAANPIGLVVVAIAALIAGLVLAYRRSETFRNVVNGAFDAVKTAFSAMRAAIAAGITFIVSVFNGGGGRIGAIIRGAVGVVRDQLNGMLNIAKGIINTVVGVFTGDFGRVKQGVSQALGGVVGLMTALPKRILSALGDLGGLLADAGRELIAGLIGGITKKLGDLRKKMGEVAKTIGRFLPGSPVREGPLTSWNRGAVGERLIGLVSRGITRGGPGVAAALDSSLRALDVSTRPVRLSSDLGLGGGLGGGTAGGVKQTNHIYGSDNIIEAALRQAGRELAFARSTGI